MKRKIILILTTCLMLCASLTGLIACDDEEQHVEHTYSSEWSYDRTYHWHATTCGCDKTADYAKHNFVGDECYVCGVDYERVAFTSGSGTQTDPYIISTADELANVGKIADFRYYKVKDGVEQLDLSSWTPVRLNGSFDGNGVKLVNLANRLFTHVGNNEEKEIYVKNFEVTINFVSSTHAALIKEIDNFGTTTFENVKIHGYIEGESNMASLFSFGTQNGHSTGSNYTVELKNVKVDATLVCVTAQPFGAFVAHAYAGTGNKLTLKIDDQTEFTGEVYSAGGKCNEYVSIGTYEIYKNNQLITQTNLTVNPITKVVPVSGADGFTVTASENVSKITVSITAQITAYDDEGNVIPNRNGITMTFSTKSITENLTGDVKVCDAFTNVEIVNGASEYKAEIVNGVLKLYVAQGINYESGIVRIQVQQYNAQGGVVSCGTLNAYTIVK